MADALSMFVLRILDVGQQHPWLFAALALVLVFVCAFKVAGAIRGRPLPGRVRCRACRHACPPGFAAGACGASARCPECGSSIERPLDVVHEVTPRRIGLASAWASVGACAATCAVLVDDERLSAWHGEWAALLAGTTLLDALNSGDMAAARAAAAVLGGSGPVQFSPDSYLRAVRMSSPFTDPDAPARTVWAFAGAVEAGWQAAKYGVWQQQSNSSAAGGVDLDYSAIPDAPAWPRPALRPMCGNGRPLSTDFSVTRTLEDSEFAREFGEVLAQWPWELVVHDGRQTSLRWHAPGDALLNLPLCVAGSYRVVVQLGGTQVATGALIVCQTGPCFYMDADTRGECVISSIDGIAIAPLLGGAALSMDLIPDAGVPLSMPGEGPLWFECPPLRCDPAPHMGLPLHVRFNGVPGQLASAAP